MIIAVVQLLRVRSLSMERSASSASYHLKLLLRHWRFIKVNTDYVALTIEKGCCTYQRVFLVLLSSELEMPEMVEIFAWPFKNMIWTRKRNVV